MGKGILKIASILVAIVLVPYIVTLMISGAPLKELPVKEDRVKIHSDLEDSEGVFELDDYIMSALAANISLDSEMETLKAQAVIIRTMVYYIQSTKTEDQSLTLQEIGLETISMEELRSQYNEEEYNSYVSKLENAVASTKNEIVTYENTPIMPYFHYSNDGKTRSYEDAYGQSLPYLTSVASGNDVEASVAVKTLEIPIEDAITKIKEEFSIDNLTKENFFSSISVTKRDACGYIIEIMINDLSVTGEQFQELFGLNSTNFYLENYDGTLRIVCKGKGSGLGFSQYGANCMAEEGKTYKELLTYYFTGTGVIPVNG